MAYRCVHCSETYRYGSEEILNGCACGSKFFFYMKDEKYQEILRQKASEEEKIQIEQDVREIAGLETDTSVPVFLDFESIKIVKPGKYLLDLAKLFSQTKPHVYQLED